MKKLLSMYKSYMLRAILYKTVTRTAVVACLCLLWQRFVSDGTFTIWEAPVFALGVLMLGWAWANYLRLDGVRPLARAAKPEPGSSKKRRHTTRSIVDFADEKIVAFEELEPDERIFCSMLSSLLIGLPMTLAGIGASIL